MSVNKFVTFIQTLLQRDLNKKNYMSSIDKFLSDFDEKNAQLSESQEKINQNYQRIATLRDEAQK